MFCIFDKNHGIGITLPADADEAVTLAAGDLLRDLRQRSGRKDGFALCAGGGIRVRQVAGEPESYTVTVTEDGIDIAGSDTLGMVYGLYAVSEKLLGYEPLFLFHDTLPEVTEVLYAEAQTIVSRPRTVKLRGWFLNDEDLLTDWKYGGDRHIDYRFYRHVMHPEVLELVLETMLRLELNFIIPSSFVDILNPPEEKLVQTACRRGLYVSQHHVEPLGVSWFSAAKQLGTDEVSYFRDPDALEAVWQTYAERWAKYGEHIVWQLGLRGKGDTPVWDSDPSFPKEPALRGERISAALHRQCEIIRAATGRDDPVCTLTLWNEMADLYRDGHLSVPPRTTVVFSDIGPDSMFADDFYNTPRRDGERYGVYYHIAYYGRGAHLCEGVSPEKLQYCFDDARRLRSLDYAVINVSNVRPFVYSLALNAAQLREPQTDVIAEGEAYDRRIFGALAPKITEGRRRYYAAMGEFSETGIREECARHQFSYRCFGKLPFTRFTLTDGSVRYMARFTMNGKGWTKAIDAEAPEKIGAAVERLTAVLDYWQSLRREIPQERLHYFDLFLLGQTRYLLRMNRYTAAVLRRDCAAAAAEAQAMLEERKETDEKWRDWYRGDEKIDVQRLHDDVLKWGKSL